MSYIRAVNDGPKWVDEAVTSGLYVYSTGNQQIIGMPSGEYEFVEVVMRMIDQSDQLTDETLEDVMNAFATRFHWVDRDRSRRVTRTDASAGLATAIAYLQENDLGNKADELEEVWEVLERGDIDDFDA